MGPPKKGTILYEKYLLKQKNRRKTKRKGEKKSNQAAHARPFVVAALQEAHRRCQSALDEKVLSNNQKLRENNHLLKKTTSLGHSCDKLTESLKAQKALTKELTEKLANTTAELEKVSKQLRGWTLWWAWVAAKAKPQLLTHLGRLGRSPPKSSGDCGWGGGQ
jgi:septal ring factor EnvC (AmiA/AmiB activator)